MTIKNIESKVDALADTANAGVADAHDQSKKAAHKAGEAVGGAKTAVDGMAKTVGERMEEAVEKAGHSAHQLTDKAVHAAQKVTEKVAHAVKETAAKASDKVKGR